MTTPWKKAVQEQRRKIAEERNAKWTALTPEQQLDALDNRLGVGIGAKKQRARLQKLIDAAPKSVEPKEKARKKK